MFLAFFGVIEYFFHDLWLFFFLRSPHSLKIYPRISSLMQCSNQFGVLLSVGLLLGLILHKEKSISALECYFGVFMFTIAIALSASRNSWLLLPVGVFLAWLYKVITLRKVFFIVGFLVFFILFFPVSTNQLGIRDSQVVPLMNFLRKEFKLLKITTTQSGKPRMLTFPTPIETTNSRVSLWKAAIPEIAKRPVTGMGIQVYEKIIGSRGLRQKGCNTHNLFLNILVELGIPGLLLFFFFIYSLLKRANWHCPIIVIPLIMVFAAQMVDFFIHDFTFTTIGLYFLAEAGNSQHEGN